jgi:uncharacterized protein (TIGR02246 family)
MAFSGPIEDRVAIQELNADYGDAVCIRDREAFAAVWADDASWTLPWGEPVVGRDAITSHWYAMIGDIPFHNYSGFLGALKIDGDAGNGRVWTTERVQNKNGEIITLSGRYDDQYAKRDGRWYFQSRKWTALAGTDQL